jgi:hypothetical protein
MSSQLPVERLALYSFRPRFGKINGIDNLCSSGVFEYNLMSLLCLNVPRAEVLTVHASTSADRDGNSAHSAY